MAKSSLSRFKVDVNGIQTESGVPMIAFLNRLHPSNGSAYLTIQSMAYLLASLLTVTLSATDDWKDSKQAADYIPKEVIGTVGLNLKRIREIEGAELFPSDYTDLFFAEEFHFQPSELDHVRLVFAPGNSVDEFSLGFIVRFAAAIDVRKKIAQIDELEPEDIPGQQVDDLTIYACEGGFHAIQVDRRTLVLSESEPFAMLMAASKGDSSEVIKSISNMDSKLLIDAVVALEDYRKIWSEAVEKETEIPEPLRTLPEQVDFIEIQGRLKSIALVVDIEIRASKTQLTRKIESSIKQLLNLSIDLQTRYLQPAGVDGVELDKDSRPWYLYTLRMLKFLRRELDFKREGKKLSAELKFDNFFHLAWGMIILWSDG